MAMESLPWLAYHAQQMPGLGTKFQKFRERAAERAKERIQRGATIKDLFYYLVRVGEMIDELFAHFSLE